MHHVDSGFAARHKYRRVLLERLALERKLSLIGAANLSECDVGWFVKDGIDDLPFQPLTGLYKTQVRQLAKALALPSEISTQLPSPDMAKGVTDEFGIGHDYSVVDQVIDGVDRGLTAQDIAKLGIPLGEITDIQELMQLSDWKRQSPHEAPPVDGKLAGGLRRTTEGQGS
ncbi:NAD(+) synthase [Marivita geojedonensis]|nr:NAD(+) synthase [Marivita geojedonensis]PRY81514.1 NAD+ synthetase [Marivita geojedonensis]